MQRVERICSEPEPSRVPREGDRYIAHWTGAAVTVIKVETSRGRPSRVWYVANSGLRFNMAAEQFMRENRRIEAVKAGRGAQSEEVRRANED